MKKNMRKLNNIELFAGAGGLLDGFEQTNKFNFLAAVEWLEPQVRTLVNRLENKYGVKNAKQKVLNFDIQRIDELINGWNDSKFGTNNGLNSLINNEKIDVISGGPPCQAYSLAGRIRDKNGMKEDYRNFLFESYIKLVDYYKPKVIVFENVQGMLSAIPTGEKITDLIKMAFQNIGYEIIDDLQKYALLDLSDFGVPQKRKRIIIIGLRKDDDNVDYQNILRQFYIEKLANQKVSKIQTVRNAIFDLPPIFPIDEPVGKKAYTNDSTLNGHTCRYHSKRDQEIFHTLAQDISNNIFEYESSQKLIDYYFKMTGNKTNVHKYHVLRWDEPSNTIPAHLKKDGLRHIHPDPTQKRTITVREAARLQTFDDDFEFHESQSANFEMIGNAVPPLFAKKLGDLLPELIQSVEEIEEKQKEFAKI